MEGPHITIEFLSCALRFVDSVSYMSLVLLYTFEGEMYTCSLILVSVRACVYESDGVCAMFHTKRKEPEMS
jgi:hypothetical protein